MHAEGDLHGGGAGYGSGCGKDDGLGVANLGWGETRQFSKVHTGIALQVGAGPCLAWTETAETGYLRLLCYVRP